ncbi:hypothetical protein [Streptomyces violascens]|uniref:hypothetical protein n=1 Tax=Streptomyces violascens TaxID=67381 RepID=UPI00167B9098|nr:hypothetical protein [Streptomyces violascens]GGU29751.1 hypothetical protein GCM10010289_58910 [Streptomyces violascens]
MVDLALVVQLACSAATGTTQRSIGQMVTAQHMQARMQGVSTWLTGSARPAAAAVAGAIGLLWGVWSALVVGSTLLVVPEVLLVLSPLHRLRTMPKTSAEEVADPLSTAMAPSGDSPVLDGGDRS